MKGDVPMARDFAKDDSAKELGTLCALARCYDHLTAVERANNVKRILALLQVLPPNVKSRCAAEIAEVIGVFEAKLMFFSKVRERFEGELQSPAGPSSRCLEHFYENAFELAEKSPDLCFDETYVQKWLQRLERKFKNSLAIWPDVFSPLHR